MAILLAFGCGFAFWRCYQPTNYMAIRIYQLNIWHLSNFQT